MRIIERNSEWPRKRNNQTESSGGIDTVGKPRTKVPVAKMPWKRETILESHVSQVRPSQAGLNERKKAKVVLTLMFLM